MPKLNLTQIRTRNNRVLKQYENYGVKVFRKALIEQATNPDPKIMLDAYLLFYERVFVDAAKREYNRIREGLSLPPVSRLPGSATPTAGSSQPSPQADPLGIRR